MNIAQDTIRTGDMGNWICLRHFIFTELSNLEKKTVFSSTSATYSTLPFDIIIMNSEDVDGI